MWLHLNPEEWWGWPVGNSNDTATSAQLRWDSGWALQKSVNQSYQYQIILPAGKIIVPVQYKYAGCPSIVIVPIIVILIVSVSSIKHCPSTRYYDCPCPNLIVPAWGIVIVPV